MNKILSFIVLSFGLLWLSMGSAFANWLVISGISYNQAASTVTFTVNWKNSWRVTTSPSNWDAAWCFVKFRECGAAPTTVWTHGTVSTVLGDHTFGTLEPTLADGSAVGIDAAPNNLGVMLRRSTTGVFPDAGNVTVTLKVPNLPAAGTLIDVKVFGVEMVYVPQAPYFVGDNTSQGSFAVAQITSEAAQSVVNANVWPYYGSTVALAATFPKGYKAFYCMKYEISQGQYVDFLNTLPSTAQVARYAGDCPTGCGSNYRYELDDNGTPPNMYVAFNPDRAMNYINWDDLSSYLDWSALRPLSEMEYEKACRGQGPVIANEYAWGSTFIQEATTLSSTVPSEDGTEAVLNVNANCNYYNGGDFTGGDGWRGPLRVGIFATAATTTRQQTGSTYYGIMEMSGNLWEITTIVSANGSTSFTGGWGDGYPDATTGNHNVATWPAWNVTDPDGNSYVGLRGGSWGDDWPYQRICDRYNIWYGWVNGNSANVGGRGVR